MKGIPQKCNMIYKSCSNCFLEKPVSDFALSGNPKSKNEGKWRGECKKCHCHKTYNSVLEKRMGDNPDNYWECDKCDSINAIRRKVCRACKEKKK